MPPPSPSPFADARPDDVEDEMDGEARTTETQVVIAPPSVSPGRPLLTLLSGVNAGEIFSLDQVETVIGRAREAGVRIDALGISRSHARILRLGQGAYSIEDMGSTNGVYVNGVEVKRADLTPGDQLQIGSDVILRFNVVDAAEEKLARQLFESSTRDALTGAWSRKYFLNRLQAEVAYAERHHGQLGLVLFDLDHFKLVNDSYGHAAGDAVLRDVGLRVAGLLREEDVFARYGGEEFAILIRGVTGDSAVRLADRVRKTVGASSVPWQTGELRVTLSAGVALFDDQSRGGVNGLIDLADRRLYAAKAGGRNCVVSG
jgi:diguanylate cyclase (GGDEF)-like protein